MKNQATEIVSYVDKFEDNVNYENIFDNLIHILYKMITKKFISNDYELDNNEEKNIHFFIKYSLTQKKIFLQMLQIKKLSNNDSTENDNIFRSNKS